MLRSYIIVQFITDQLPVQSTVPWLEHQFPWAFLRLIQTLNILKVNLKGSETQYTNLY